MGSGGANNQPYGHILPEAEPRLNILPGIRDEFWAYAEANRSQLALHTDFHHLNSSQAFAFNLFFPWVTPEGSPEALLDALGHLGPELKSWSFEFMPDQSERTTVDFCAELSDGTRLLVEVKLTEEHFGGIVPKESHQRKRRDFYLPRLNGKVREDGLTEPLFFLNYQLFRNVSHLNIARGDQLLLVLPRANEFTWQQGEAFRLHLEPRVQPAVRLVGAEDLVERLTFATEAVSVRLVHHMRQMKEKYLCAASADIDH